MNSFFPNSQNESLKSTRSSLKQYPTDNYKNKNVIKQVDNRSLYSNQNIKGSSMTQINMRNTYLQKNNTLISESPNSYINKIIPQNQINNNQITNPLINQNSINPKRIDRQITWQNNNMIQNFQNNQNMNLFNNFIISYQNEIQNLHQEIMNFKIYTKKQEVNAKLREKKIKEKFQKDIKNMKEQYQEDFNIMKEQFKKGLKDKDLKLEKNDKQLNNINKITEIMNDLYINEINNIKSNIRIINTIDYFNIEAENGHIKIISKILEELNKVIFNTNDIKQYLNEQIENQSNEINLLKNKIKILEEKVKEIQELLIGRKLLKIILKKIIQHCFIRFDIVLNNKNFY